MSAINYLEVRNILDIGREQTIIAVAHKTAQAGGGLAFGSGIAQWIGENYDLIAGVGILFGIAVGVIGLTVQVHFQRKRDRREQTLHDQLMRKHG